MATHVEIIAGEHDPPHPFVDVDRRGIHVDLTGVQGHLWDVTASHLVWGLRDGNGGIFGRITFKNGNSRTFGDPLLILPYVAAHSAAVAAQQNGE